MKQVGRNITAVLLVLMFLSIVSVPVRAQDQPAEPEQATKTLAEVDQLMENKTVENCEKAIKGYEALLKDDPNNYELLYKTANAYIGVIEIKTDSLMVEKDEYKPLLKKMGQIANDYAEKAYKIKPKNREVVAACLLSYGYLSASYGIVKAIFKGAAGHYKDLCAQLNAIDEKYQGALGYRSLGKLYHVAPWPVGSKKKALINFKKAVEIDNECLYSHYYVGLLNFDKKNYDEAEKHFKFVVENDPPQYEKHMIGAYIKDSRYYLRQIARKRKE